MRMRIASLLVLLSLTATPALSMTLEGSVEKFFDVRAKKTDVEGRIGVRISTFGRIAKVHPGSPADAAGLQRNDTVILVDGKKHAIDEISGEPGTTVHLKVKRGWRHKFEVAVERKDYRELYY